MDHFDHSSVCLNLFLNLYIMLLSILPSGVNVRIAIPKSSFNLNKFTHSPQPLQLFTSFTYCLVRDFYLRKKLSHLAQSHPKVSVFLISLLVLRFHHAWSATYQSPLHLVLSPYLNVVQPMSERLVLFSRTHPQR